MAMNRVQFQRGLSMAEFMDQYGSDEQCEAALIASRWRAGFGCPACGCGVSSSFRRERRLYSARVLVLPASMQCYQRAPSSSPPSWAWFAQQEVNRGDESPAPCVLYCRQGRHRLRKAPIVTKRRPGRRNCARDSAHQEHHLLPMAEAGRDHQTWSGRLEGIGEAKPLAAPFDVTSPQTRCIRVAEVRR